MMSLQQRLIELENEQHFFRLHAEQMLLKVFKHFLTKHDLFQIYLETIAERDTDVQDYDVPPLLMGEYPIVIKDVNYPGTINNVPMCIIVWECEDMSSVFKMKFPCDFLEEVDKLIGRIYYEIAEQVKLRHASVEFSLVNAGKSHTANLERLTKKKDRYALMLANLPTVTEEK